MNSSMPIIDISEYLTNQINNIYPDKYTIKNEIDLIIDEAFLRLEFCFSHVAFSRYNDGENTLYNHLYADHNVMLIWFLSNTVWKKTENINLASKLYYLNKTLHGLDCMYDTKLPDIFLLFHSSGTMLGKAEYSDYFVALQGCTLGSHKGMYPKMGKGVSLTANSSLIGNCNIGDRVTISTRTTLYNKNIINDHTVFMNFEEGKLEVKRTKECYAQQFFKTDLKNI